MAALRLSLAPARPAGRAVRSTRLPARFPSRVTAAEAQAPPTAAEQATSAPTDASVGVSATATAQAGPPAPPTSTPTSPPSFTLTLASTAARAGLRLAEVWDGAAPAIVVVAVADELAALTEGRIRPGVRVLSLPHPTRRPAPGEPPPRWELTPGNAPISRVRDYVRVTRGVSIDMEFSTDTIPDEAIGAWVEAQERAAAARAAAAAGAEGEEEGEEEEEGGGGPAALPDVPTTPPSYLPSPEAVAFEDEARRLATRLSARAARNAAEDARDDTPLLIWSTVAFLGPAAAILAWAYGTGLLDSLATHQY